MSHPDAETGVSGADYFPADMPRQTFYEPTTSGYERNITERLRHWATLRGRSSTTPREPRPTDTSPEGQVT